VSRDGVNPVLVELEAGSALGACEAMVEDVVTIAVCESVNERTGGVSRRHADGAAMAMVRVRNLSEILKRAASG
jgi:hypothetical protein